MSEATTDANEHTDRALLALDDATEDLPDGEIVLTRAAVHSNLAIALEIARLREAFVEEMRAAFGPDVDRRPGAVVEALLNLPGAMP